jgi:hypothetical protein
MVWRIVHNDYTFYRSVLQMFLAKPFLKIVTVHLAMVVTITWCCSVRRQLPTIAKLHESLKDDIKFDGSVSLLRNVGFKWKRSKGRRKVIIERYGIVGLLCRYLNKIREYHENKHEHCLHWWDVDCHFLHSEILPTTFGTFPFEANVAQ